MLSIYKYSVEISTQKVAFKCHVFGAAARLRGPPLSFKAEGRLFPPCSPFSSPSPSASPWCGGYSAIQIRANAAAARAMPPPLLLCLAGGSAAVQHTASRCAQAQEGRNMRATRVRPQGGVGPAIPGRVYAEREGRDGIFQQHWYIHTSALPAHPPCPVPSMNEHHMITSTYIISLHSL